ncbi:hypothetical protein FAP39_04200 [Shimia litoralis]|uniref:CopG family transcriptional regulator n=1 Tax=Shimia litoralis TaxID=420403 RepID=A0A4U7N7E5_9RHOB|nr:hypothetical protein [Shimia litoralis]TKZ21810.1 hypothetical protein FAP39_04200 [Shimia litoralis]
MAKKDTKKVGKKDSQLVLRLDKAERDAFVDLCKDMDTSAAREIRRFIRVFMKENVSSDET